MSRELDVVERQSALCAPLSENTGTSQGALVRFSMVRNEEVVRRDFLEALLAAPGHILQRQERTVSRQQEVEVPHADDGVVGRLDDMLEHVILRRSEGRVGKSRIVVGTAEDIPRRALAPVGADRGVDGFLNIRSAEVDLASRRFVVTRIHDAKNRVSERTFVADVIDVKAGVCLRRRVKHRGLHVARLVSWAKHGELAGRRRESEVLLVIVRVAALVRCGVQRLQEGLVQIEKVGPVVDVGRDDDFGLEDLIAKDRVVDRDTGEVVVDLVFGVDKCVGNVGDVEAAVGFASQVDLAVLHLERLDELLVEADEFLAQLDLVRDVWSALGETDADWLFDPEENHVSIFFCSSKMAECNEMSVKQKENHKKTVSCFDIAERLKKSNKRLTRACLSSYSKSMDSSSEPESQIPTRTGHSRISTH